MIINEKEKIILNILLKSDTPLTIKEISKLSKIKERTLYREIKNLNLFLQKNNLQLTKNKSKYSIVGDTNSLDSSILDISLEQAYSQDTRINLILCTLLLSNETSIKELSEKLFISYNTVATVITTTEQILKDYKITLTRKKGQGISLIGDTIDKQILLLSILCNEINDEEFFYAVNKTDYYSVNPFIKFIDITLIREIFVKNKEINVFNIYTDSSIKKILIAINIALLINYDDKYTEDKLTPTNTEQKNIKELITILSSHSNIFNTIYFRKYITNILKTCKLIEQVTYVNDKYSYTLIFKVHTLINNISKKSNIDFSKDPNLANGLIAHIESAIKRYQLKLVEENNDLQTFVLKNYNELYLIIKSELLNIFDEINFSSTELSYIVIHFASSYEQIYRENFVRALVVCSSGIGSSKILGSLIRKNIPEIKNIEYSTHLKLNEDIKKNYDIIISTIKLPEHIDYILIPTILQEKDIDNIRKKLFSVRSFKQVSYTEYNAEYNNLLEVETIVANTTIQNIKNNENIREILQIALSFLETTDITSIVDKLIERHEKSSIVIPKTNIALFHTLDNSLSKPYIIICPLENRLSMINALDNKEVVTHLFIMISPNKRIYTDLLGQISIAILEDKNLKETIKSNNIDFIKTKLELIMTKYLLLQNMK